MQRPGWRSSRWLPALVALLVAALGIATNVATGTGNWIAWTFVVALAFAVAGGTAASQGRQVAPAKEGDPEVSRGERKAAALVSDLKRACAEGKTLEQRAAHATDDEAMRAEFHEWQSRVEAALDHDDALVRAFRTDDWRDNLWANIEIEACRPPVQNALNRRLKALQGVINDLSV